MRFSGRNLSHPTERKKRKNSTYIPNKPAGAYGPWLTFCCRHSIFVEYRSRRAYTPESEPGLPVAPVWSG